MVNGDHGAYFVNNTGGYSLTQKRSLDGKIEISIIGTNPIKGLLIYAHDAIGNRFGNFETKVAGVAAKSDCGGVGLSNTMQHSDDTLKNLPLTFTWSPTPDASAEIVHIEALIVIEFRSWYILKKISFNYLDPTSSVDTTDSNTLPTIPTTSINNNDNRFFGRFVFSEEEQKSFISPEQIELSGKFVDNPFNQVVNGQKNTVKITFDNKGELNYTITVISGRLVNPSNHDEIFRNLTGIKYSLPVPPMDHVEVSYSFYSEFQPQELDLIINVFFTDKDGKIYSGVGYNSTRVTKDDDDAAGTATGSTATTSNATYDESWIPEHILKSSQGRTSSRNIVIAADELCLSLLVEYLQDRIISKKYQAIKNNLCYCLTMTNRYQSLSKLYLHFNSLMKNRAHMIFQSFDFNLLDKDILISLLKSSDLMMDEIDVWKCVIKWCCLQQPNLPYPNNLKQKDLEVLKIRCRDFLPFINFNHISKNDFISNIKPLKSIFDPEFFEKIDDYYNLASKNSLIHYNLLLSKRRGINSKLIGICQLYLISDWLDGLTPSSTYLRSPSSSSIRSWAMPYELKLILRGSEDGFTPRTFYQKCSNINSTLILIKTSAYDLFGGYNPLSWSSIAFKKIKSKKSFIFRMDLFNNQILNTRLSRVKLSHHEHALINDPESGPIWNSGLSLYSKNINENFVCKVFNGKEQHYEKKLLYSKQELQKGICTYNIDEIEVFQIIKKKNLC
nr:7138_t:CDS:2 [Entrophospora candida]